MEEIILEVTQEANKYAEEARQILENFGAQVCQIKEIAPEVSSLTFRAENLHPETMAHLNANGFEGLTFDKKEKRFEYSGHKWAGDHLYWLNAYSLPAENEIPESFQVIIGGEAFTVNH